MKPVGKRKSAIIYSDLLFQKFKRKKSIFEAEEPKLHESGSIHVFKR